MTEPTEEAQLRESLAALVKAHNRLRMEQDWLLRQLHANKADLHSLVNRLQSQLAEVANPELYLAQQGQNLLDALGANREFASLLQDYVALPEVPLVDRILDLRCSGFQAKVSD